MEVLAATAHADLPGGAQDRLRLRSEPAIAPRRFLSPDSDYPADKFTVMGAGLPQAPHTVLYGTAGLWHPHSTFRWVFRQVVRHRDLIDSNHTTG